MGSRERPLRAGLVGCGRMGIRYALALKRTSRVALGGIYDPFLTREYVESLGCKCYPDEESLLADRQIDVLIIATPSDLHKDFCIRAAEYKKHVLVEKPIALSLEDGEQMILSAEKNKVKLMVGLVERFNPVYRKVKEVLDLSALGEVVSVSLTRKTKSVNRPAWYRDIQRSGGVIVDLAIHDIDLVQWLLNDRVQTIYALSPALRIPNAANTAILLSRLGKGAIAGLDVSWELDPSYPSWGDIRMEILGERGMMAADSGLCQPLYITGKTSLPSFIHVQEDLKWSGIDLVRQDIIELMLENFAECIIEDGAIEPSGYDGLKALEVALYAKKSLDEKAPVTMVTKYK